MARIRHIAIRNFRCVQSLDWYPSAGLNCLIGPGDSGKSSVLDAIDYCLGARRTVTISDADFYRLDVEQPISISITIGELDDGLKSMEAYGLYLRNYNAQFGVIDDEPEATGETVLTVNMTVGSDLEPTWTLLSERAQAQGQSRYLVWADRLRLAPNRIGALADHNLAWRKGSVLNRLSDERADASAALAKAGREARASFGEAAEQQLGQTLQIVTDTANELGIVTGGKLKAMLDTHSVSFGGGTIALHGPDGVPLRGLGIGSTRLLLAGLQRKASADATVILIDELEFGLEPHRIVQLLGSIGAKEAQPPLQAFLTTHSPIALRELSGDQLVVLRKRDGIHHALRVGLADEVQGTIRTHPEAFLAPTVLVCEGASEIGLIRGLDLYFEAQGRQSIHAAGISLVDAKGVSKIFGRARPFGVLGYRIATLRDDDVQPLPGDEEAFVASGGSSYRWLPGRALEDEIFASMNDAAILGLLEKAVAWVDPAIINAQLLNASGNTLGLAQCQAAVTPQSRAAMATASKSKQNHWFKSVSRYEEIGRDIIGPNLHLGNPQFRAVIDAIWNWMTGAR